MTEPRARVALIVNPVATLARPSLRSAAARALAPHGLGWSLATSGTGDAAALARRAVAEGAEVVVTLGGDGTAAEVAGELAGGPVAMAVLPGGNANVFARALGWPAAPERALRALAGALAAGRTRGVHLGRVVSASGAHVMVVNAGIGLDAETVEWVEARPARKRRLRQAGYAAGALRALPGAGARLRLTVRADGGPPVAARSAVAVCGSPYTYLGARPLDLAPGARFDGRIAWSALTRARPHAVAAALVRAAREGSPAHGSALVGGVTERGVLVEAERPVAVQADGEYLGRHAWIRVEPGPLLLAVDPRAAGPPLKSGGARPT